MGKVILLVAGGFRGYQDDTKEWRDIESGLWRGPTTIDFISTAQLTSGSLYYTINNKKQFFGALASVKGKISRIVFIGHSSTYELGFSGNQLVTGIPVFTNSLEEKDLKEFKSIIDKKIIPKLLKNTTIDLVSCGTAAFPAFIQSIANAFGVTVRGYADQVYWHLNKDVKTKKMVRGLICMEKECKKKYIGISRIIFQKAVSPVVRAKGELK